MPHVTLAGFFATLIVAACGAAPPPVDSPLDQERETYAVALRLEAADAGADASTPQTAVSLVRIAPDGERTVEDLRREAGACYTFDESDVLVAARCWWGARGARYVVRREGDAVVALRAEGRDDTDELVEVGRVPIPADADLQVLRPGRQVRVPDLEAR